ncbi:hypothetical protein ACYJW8_12675 [Frateuria aurantia]
MRALIATATIFFLAMRCHAVANEVSMGDINAMLNGGGCGKQSCSVHVCDVANKVCVFYVCSYASGCTQVKQTDLDAGDIRRAQGALKAAGQ